MDITLEKISKEIKICGIIGNPLSHTLSPLMHNTAFKHLGLDYVYLTLEINENQLSDTITDLLTKGFRGLNVTMPYKSKVMAFLDKIDTLAQKIGAVNTIVNNDKKLTGYNTDAYGALEAIKRKGVDISSRKNKVLILGAGGSARAVGFALAEAGQEIIVANRTFEKGIEFAKELNNISTSVAIKLDELSDIIHDVNILINCCPVGMKGYITECSTLVPGQLIRKEMVVFDMVYSPKDTPLIQEAKSAGAKVIYGYEMFVLQGASAFELWTGKPAPLEVMRKVVLDVLEVNSWN